MTLNGLALLDKPSGPTSHDVVAAVRRAAGGSRVGHTGTLDPPASGLLLMLIGAATRLAPYVPRAPKCYAGSFRLGLTTTTDDLAGEVLSRSEAMPDPDQVLAEARRLVGTGWQVPPAVSARRIAGQRMYRAARRGVTLAAPPTPIDVERFTIERTADPHVWAFDTAVSSGTFVRGLVRDLGAALGCGAAVASLRRTRIGPFDVSDALDGRRPENIAARLISLDAIPLEGSVVVVSEEEATAFRHGRALMTGSSPDGVAAVRDRRGALLGMGVVAGGTLAPSVVLARPAAVDGESDAVVSSARSTS